MRKILTDIFAGIITALVVALMLLILAALAVGAAAVIVYAVRAIRGI